MTALSRRRASRQATVELDTGMRRDVGKLSLLFTDVGSIIGSGRLFGALYAARRTR
jgi:hypothetical protein